MKIGQPVLKKMTENGVEWLYRPGVVHTTKYHGWTINIRKVPATGGWRLFVDKGGGIGLSWKCQFHKTAAEARRVGIDLVDRYLDDPDRTLRGKAYDAGMAAAKAGDGKINNPYRRENMDYEAWARGYDRGVEEMQWVPEPVPGTIGYD